MVMNRAIRDAMESKMVADAEKMIDRMIPEEGLSTFGDPTGRSLFGLLGLGAMDLDAGGSAAFAGDDLDNEGSAAFGNSDLDSIGTSAFAGDLDADGTNAFGGFGAVGIRKFASKLRGIVTGKKDKAKANLKKVAVAQKQANTVAASESRKAMLTTNPAQKALFTQRAQAAMKKSDELVKVGKLIAVEAVNPKITREEVKAAVLPAIEDMATNMSVTGKAVIDTAMKQDVSKDAMKQVLAQSAASAVAPSVVATPTNVPARIVGGKGADMWQQRPFESREAWLKRIEQSVTPAMPGFAKPAAVPNSFWAKAGQSWKTKFAAAMPATPSGAVSGFLSMGDMDTATQDPEAGDIVQDWKSDEMFGEPLY
jgi:hypothetical protein